MGMSIDNAIGLLERGSQYNYYDSAEDFCKAYDMAIETMRKYQQLQADYENRLKADMVAILEEIDLQFDEITFCKRGEWKTVPEIKAEYKAVIQEKINELKGDQEVEE